MLPIISKHIGDTTVAVVAYTICVYLANLIDASCDPAEKAKFALLLKSGGWVKYLKSGYARIGRRLDEWLGPSYFSLNMIWTSMGLTLIGLMLLSRFLPLNYDDAAWRTKFRVVFAARAVVAFGIDYTTLVRVKYFCRRVTDTSVLRQLASSLLLDFSILPTVYFLTYFLVATYIFFTNPQLMAMPMLPVFYHILLAVFQIVESDLASNRLASGLIFFGLPALVPSLLFYLYTFSLLGLKAITFIASRFSYLVAHLEFEKPFVFVGHISGIILFCSIVAFKWLAGSFYN